MLLLHATVYNDGFSEQGRYATAEIFDYQWRIMNSCHNSDENILENRAATISNTASFDSP
jgi:hypothetical protein